MSSYLVVGAGPIGRGVARLLVERGERVTLASSSGQGPDVPGAQRLALDAADASRTVPAAHGSAAIFDCTNPHAYHRWAELWPPMAAGLRIAAERSGAVLVTMGNLYPYGPVDVPMTEDLPDVATESKGAVRARLWGEALAAHRAGRLRAAEVRASDYAGPGVGDGGHLTRQVAALRQGKPARIIGSADQPHSWTDVRDAARTLVAVADRESAWGRTWHVPSNEPRTQREALTEVAAAGGFPSPRISVAPDALLLVAGLFVPLMREARSVSFQFARPFVMDSTAAQREFGIAPTPWDEVVRATAADN